MNRTKNLVFIPFFLTFLIVSFHCAEASINPEGSTGGWKAGVASIVITPEQPMWMAGYSARKHPSDGMLHDLWAKALVLEDANGEQAVLITTDLLGFPKDISDQIRDRLEDQYNLSRAQIILSSSHTHSGPVLEGALYDIYPLDSDQLERIEEYSGKLIDQIVTLVGEALNSMQPAQLYAENGVVRFQVNRRNNNAVTLSQQTELQGPNDYAVPVIKVMDEAGELIAVAFGYACHPTVLDIYKWSGDYPGYAQIELEESYPGTVALFFQGAGADMNPLPRRSVALAQQYGEELAAAVRRVLNEDMQELPSNLSTAYSEIELEFTAPPTREELSQMTRESSGYQKQWAVRMLEKMERGEPFRTSYPYPVQIWKLGNQPLVSLGGEVLIDYTIRLKRIFGEDIFVMGYSNDGMAYIPSVRVLREGGYEGAVSQIVYGLPGTWKANIESDIIQEVMRLAEEVNIKMPESRLITYPDTKAPHPLTAKYYFSGFDQAHDTYNAISPASDGKIYYVLSSQSIDVGGQMYSYDPDNDEVEFIADLTDVCGEEGLNAISQGKSHVNFYERDGKLYFATHVGYYQIIDGMEKLAKQAPEGYKLYPGGHILSYDLKTGEFEDL
ncbi:MAG: neutral/alkaline non-lysosomal ceramidase N-terminal domain-containing protein, partial [Bacteroidales bacterium]|nr:neutral/alkaline non-lysosomal ceramidase N-terminal domain-containing protein [Bacteroidales bacterium]